jgi:CO/xanthine dehydrogenase Mo-binding subunit
MAATMSRPSKMAFDADNKITGFKVDTIANLGAYMSLFSSSVPTYLYATLLSGQYNIPASTPMCARSTPTPCRWTPIAAPAVPKRPIWWSGLSKRRRANSGISPAELRRKNFIREFPHQTPVIMCYDAGDFEASLDAAMKAVDYAGFEARKAEAEKRGKLAGIGMSCYIEACGIAPSAGGGFARRRRRALGIGRSAGQCGRHGRGSDRLAQPRPGPRNHLCTAGCRPLRRGIDSVSIVMATPTRCRWAWAPTARAPARSACRRWSRRSTRSRSRPRNSPRTCWKPMKATSSSRMASSRSQAPTRACRGSRWRSPPTPHTTCRKAWSRGSRKARSTTRPTSPSRPAATSARWRSIRKPARPKSSSSLPPTISARSSIR